MLVTARMDPQDYWLTILNNCADRRCDFASLLRDAFRHRVQFRDGPGRFGSRCCRDIPFSAIQPVAGERGSVDRAKAEIVTAFHLLLDAYGFGAATAIAVVDATNSASLTDAQVHPTVIEHSEFSSKWSGQAVADICRRLADYDCAPASQGILGQGLFDLTIVFTRDDLRETPYSGPVNALFQFDAASGLIGGRIVYSETLVEPATVEGLIGLLEVLLRQIRAEPDKTIGEFLLVSDAERRLLDQFNATDGDFQDALRVEDLFEAAVRRTPAARALCTDELVLTYDQLNKRANRFARWLTSEALGVEAGQFVGLLLERSHLPVVATIALWKAGATCVPIDPAQPVERVAAILRETGTSMLIANERHANALRAAFAQRGITVSVVAAEAISEHAADCSGEDLGLPLDNVQAAYVMYTSGTTGEPKCVAKPHISVVNSITDLSERYGLIAAPGEERVLLFSGCGFEPFMRQLLLALINSQILVVVADDIRLDPHRLPDFLARHAVTHLNGTGSVIRNFDLTRCPTLRRIALVGEELTTAGLRELRQVFRGQVINEYAFTEATFVTAIKLFAPDVINRDDRSIGRPLRNVRWYVLDKYRRQLPIGAVGELHVGGRSIADGYLNNDGLSAERFHEDPAVKTRPAPRVGNGLIYATGDIARVLPNGEVEFLGRRDFQLKINGVRIEPGEIESHVAEFPGIRKCVVLPRDWPIVSGRSSLVGFYTTTPGADVEEASLISFLETRLVPVMIPSRMLKLDAFPVTPIGKVDWRSLLAMAQGRSTTSDVTPAPPPVAGSTARILRDIWAEVLAVAPAEISETAEFFRLGGDSISTIKLVARIRERLQRLIRVDDVAAHASFDAFVAFVDGQPVELIPAKADSSPATRQAMERPTYGLQQGLLYRALNTPSGDDIYVLQTVHFYGRAVRPDLMELAWRRAYARFPALRLRFPVRELPVQRLDLQPAPMDWSVVDFTGSASPAHTEPEFDAFCERQRRDPFDLEGGPLFRLRFVHQDASRAALIFTCHHILLDGWSLSVLHEAVHRSYLALLDGKLVDEPPDDAFFAAQVHWDERHGDNVDYWTREVERIEQSCDLRGLLKLDQREKIDVRGYNRICNHQMRRLTVAADTYAALRASCANHGLTIHSALQFAFHTALGAFGGGSQTVIGTIVSGRAIPVPGIETAVGLFINTLPIIVEHGPTRAAWTVAQAMAEIQRSTTALNAFSTVNLAEIATPGPKGRLFDALLMFENYPMTAGDRHHQDVLAFERRRDVNKVDHPLQIVGREANETLEIDLWHAGELFDEAMIAIFLQTVSVIFDQIARDATQTLSELSLVDRAALAIFDCWNATERDFSRQSTLIDVFEQVAARWPHERALVFRQVQLSYAETDELSNRLAQLIALRIAPKTDDLIAIVMDKSEWMIASLLAVWKAGAAYVPIDPSYPPTRIAYILDDTSTRLVLADPAYRERLATIVRNREARAAVDILVPQEEALQHLPNRPPHRTAGSDDLAYAIYTSGTTGQPKAVLVEHRGVVNLRESLAQTFALDRSRGPQTFLSFSNIVFDHFVEQMTDALLNGQTLVVLDDDLRTDNEALRRCIRTNGVTYLSGTPSVLSTYDLFDCPSLRIVDAIGEDLTRPAFDSIRRWFDGVIVNGYGPTEISITSHKRPYARSEPRRDKSIGLPVANTRSYLLDDMMRRIPIGGIGELYIGGVGVTRGYLNRAGLTSERFVPDPFVRPDPDGARPRLYRTGDLCRWLPNGEIEYFGRADGQVKINGQRIELGEVESELLSYPGVERAVVIAREQGAGRKYLAAFYLAAADIPEREMTAWLRDRLPAALIPGSVTRIAQVPVTPSGKLNVAALPNDAVSGDASQARPKTPLERALRGIWSEVLAVTQDRIGIDDNFFALGGDSLAAIRLTTRVTSELALRLTLPEVFDHVTIEAQARRLEASESGAQPSLASHKLPRAGNAPITSAQERLLFIDELLGGTSAYNIPLVLAVDIGRVSAETVKTALRFLVRRHASLRTLISGGSDGARFLSVLDPAAVLAMLSLTVKRLANRREMDSELLANAEHIFRLDRELPLRIALMAHNEDPARLYVGLVFHHSCFDGRSMEIFRGEFARLVGQGNSALSAAGAATYADYAVWQRDERTEVVFALEDEFWRERLSGAPALDLPLDKPRPAIFDHRGFETLFSIDSKTRDGLKGLARSCGVSFYTVLLATSALLLESYSGQAEFTVGTPTNNRLDRRFEDVIGLFANLVVIQIRVDRNLTIARYLRTVSDRVNEALRHQHVPFDRVVKALGVAPDNSRHPLFQALVTLLPPGVEGETSAATVTDYSVETKGQTSAKFDLALTFAETEDGIKGNVTVPCALFEPESAAGFARTFSVIASEIVRLSAAAETETLGAVRSTDDSDSDASGVERLSAVAEADAPALKTTAVLSLAHLFENVAALHGTDLALVCGDRRLSYNALNLAANRLAARLIAGGATPGERSAIVLDIGEHAILAILAVWKAGCAYIPLDPSYPSERLAFVLGDADVRLVLTDRANYERVLSLTQGQILVVDEVSTASAESSGNLGLDRRRDSEAYVIYTSGTSGKPKGVVVNDGNVLSFHDGLAERIFGSAAAKRQTVLLTSNIVFDFSIEQICLSLLSGHSLLVDPTQVLDDDTYARLNANGLTYLSGTPTQIGRFDLTRLTSLETVLIAGESVGPHHVSRIRATFAGRLLTAYGTTETTVYNTLREFKPDDGFANDLGSPLPNTCLAILDASLRPAPGGARGQLFIAGPCVSAGYLNRPDLNVSRFGQIPECFEATTFGADKRVFATGDIVRRHPRGYLEFHGRNDTQVKINGFRVDLAEIEAVLGSCPVVKQCAVIMRSSASGRQEIIAYYVAEKAANSNFGDAQLQTETPTYVAEYLLRFLPRPMVPSHILTVSDRLPTTVNGKLDVAALPTPHARRPAERYSAPRTRRESEICEAFSDALGVEQVGIDDDFFRSGGDSIAALHLATRLRPILGSEVNVRWLFDHPTVRRLVVFADQCAGAHAGELSEHAELLNFSSKKPIPATPIQNWFFAKKLSQPAFWNQEFAFRTGRLEIGRLVAAVRRLAELHKAFSLCFETDALGESGEAMTMTQRSNGRSSIAFHQADIGAMESEDLRRLLDGWQSGFDLSKGELAAVAYLHGYADGSARIWFAAHHLIVDRVSWTIILRDLEILYNGGEVASEDVDYGQWARALRLYELAPDEVALWRQVAEDVANDMQSRAASPGQIAPVERRLSISSKQTARLRSLAGGGGALDMRDLLMAALGHAAQELVGVPSRYITLENHGREAFDPRWRLERTVGWFTTLHPVRVEIADNPMETAQRVKAWRDRVPYNGLGYGISRGTLGSAEAPLPPISFNYLGRIALANSKPSRRRDADRWQLDVQMFGLRKSAADLGMSQGALDVTAWLAEDELILVMDSGLAPAATEQFGDRLIEVIGDLCARSAVSGTAQAEEQSGVVSRHGRLWDFESNVMIRRSPGAPDIFLLPPGEGGAESYLGNLSRSLDTVNQVLFNNVHQHCRLDSFEQIAAYYVSKIREMRSPKPYNLLGWSFGGVVALEAARQLARGGDKTSNLILIDPFWRVDEAALRLAPADISAVIDPINLRYAPRREDFAPLLPSIGRITLFKANVYNEETREIERRRLFEYYARSSHNHLDALVPAEAINVRSLGSCDHFSWVRDAAVVAEMARHVTDLLGSKAEALDKAGLR
ncbi:amino acid adenylation domain-containing protein [Bradyrhizobium sp. HKCCYLRH3095]|uniref:amino acid adenylation domain-containing protein n=1 Tax=Bradyrhizobium sp. HKCCYLRH3095 TaxID=3420765 RepID=UPI003EC037DF